MSSSETPVLLRGVSKRYGDIQAVNNLDLEVHRAQVLALMTEDFREGVAAFVEKRTPRFEGR